MDHTRHMIGKRVELLRRLRGLSQKELGMAIGLSQTRVSALESGQRKVSSVEVERLCRALNCRLDDLIGAEGSITITFTSNPSTRPPQDDPAPEADTV